MCETHLEDMLAAYPEEFFPDRGFKLAGRQQSLRGVGRFDLLFQDDRSRYWLIELKAVALRITDTDQVMGYYEELHERNKQEAYIPCFIAPNIPHAVRNYLNGKGMEHKEITIAEFRRVANGKEISPQCGFFGVNNIETLREERTDKRKIQDSKETMPDIILAQKIDQLIDAYLRKQGMTEARPSDVMPMLVQAGVFPSHFNGDFVPLRKLLRSLDGPGKLGVMRTVDPHRRQPLRKNGTPYTDWYFRPIPPLETSP
ncbi:MAG: DUF91 domain-containing protein [Dehalococcoidia bacterium]|nr:DUF91 domain-containing protein [Dehalococcoidia bacterium]